MCFSASASFTVSAVLLVGGIATIRKVKSPSYFAFATIPILFGIQQFIEGFVWLSLSYETYAPWNHSSTVAFLIFAQVVWPALVPFSILLLEKDPMRKKILAVISILGFAVAIYLLFCILNFPVHSQIKGSHIFYDLDYRHNMVKFSGVFYFIPTVLPALISSYKRMVYFGITILLSFLVTKIFYEDYVISVWCYFAAALSILIYWIINQKKGIST